MTLTLFRTRNKVPTYQNKTVTVVKRHAPSPEGTWTTIETADGYRMDVPSHLVR